MGNAVIHFEISGQDGAKLQSFYSDLFGWKINADNPVHYGMVDREENLNAQGLGIGGGITSMEGVPNYVTVYVEVPNVEAALQAAEKLGGTRRMGPDTVMDGVEIGIFLDPAGNALGVVRAQA